MDSQIRFTIPEILTMIRDIGIIYLGSAQYKVKIDEEDADGESVYSELEMSTFLMKAVVRRMKQRGVPVAQLNRALSMLFAPEATYPSGRGLAVLAAVNVRFSDNDSPVRVER